MKCQTIESETHLPSGVISHASCLLFSVFTSISDEHKKKICVAKCFTYPFSLSTAYKSFSFFFSSETIVNNLLIRRKRIYDQPVWARNTTAITSETILLQFPFNCSTEWPVKALPASTHWILFCLIHFKKLISKEHIIVCRWQLFNDI